MKNIEIEKKYLFKNNDENKILDYWKDIKNSLKILDNKSLTYYDTYYDENGILEAYNVSFRKRDDGHKSLYVIKKDLEINDVVKREVESFNTYNEALEYLKNSYGILIETLSETKKVKIERDMSKCIIDDKEYVLNFDKINYDSFDGYMIECKINNQNSQSLNVFDKIFNNNIEVCNNSKKELIDDSIEKEVINPFSQKVDMNYYNQKIREYFNNEKLLDTLKILGAKKEQLKEKHNKFGPLEKPIVITVSGTPRAGKTTCIDNLFEFFKKANFKTYFLEEPAGLVYQTLKSKEEKEKLLQDRVGFVERQLEIGKESISKSLDKNEIILCDRGALDTYIWYDMYYKLGMVDKERYKKYLMTLKDNLNYYNQLYLLYAKSNISMVRDYQSSLSLEPRSTMNEENVKRYNNSLVRMIPTYQNNIDSVKLLDTSNYERMDASIKVANDIINKIELMYKKK